MHLTLHCKKWQTATVNKNLLIDCEKKYIYYIINLKIIYF